MLFFFLFFFRLLVWRCPAGQGLTLTCCCLSFFNLYVQLLTEAIISILFIGPSREVDIILNLLLLLTAEGSGFW